jgi:hypothetical protein
MTKEQIIKLIRETVQSMFSRKIIGDTPTDALQLVNKKYVDAHAGVGGSTTQVQYNNAGSFGGDANFTWDKDNQVLTITDPGSSNYLRIYALGGGPLAIDTNSGASLDILSGSTLALRPGSGADISTAAAGLATNATSGFFRIPYCAGTPTGTPTAGTDLVLQYDSSNNKLYVYNGAWKSVTLT